MAINFENNKVYDSYAVTCAMLEDKELLSSLYHLDYEGMEEKSWTELPPTDDIP